MNLPELRESIAAGKWPFRPAFGAGYEADVQGFSVQMYQLANSAHCGSIDAAVALLEALLPEWSWIIGSDGEAEITEKNASIPAYCNCFVVTVEGNPARALVLATIDALIEEAEG